MQDAVVQQVENSAWQKEAKIAGVAERKFPEALFHTRSGLGT
jgi:hypothetical protein